MGAFAVYTFAAGIFLLAGYLIYKWLLSTEKQPAFNRAMLLTLYAVAFVLPACHLRSAAAGGAGAGIIDIGMPDVQAATTASGEAWSPAVVLLWVYLAGMIAVAATTLRTAFILRRLVAAGKRTDCGDCVIVRIARDGIAPFSWGRYIVVNANEDTDSIGMIVSHERAHIRLGHFYDLLLAQAVCIVLWYNPASWLMLSEVKAVHEYQADGAVIDSGVNMRQYQLLLIKKAVGVRFQSLANSLNHSKLKKRITMMYESKTKPVRRLRALAAVPAVALAMALLNVPAISRAMAETSSARLTEEASAVSADKVTNFVAADQHDESKKSGESATVEHPDVLPEYPGGQAAMFAALCKVVKYPAAADSAKIQGRVVVGFTVRTDGSLSDYRIIQSVDPLLDAEALRAVKTLDVKWKPGKQDGKTVNCSFALPVTFKLQ